ncbi:MAG TPA: 6-phosphofructokinase [Armatimonadota bacterium]|nr:6-phosphofructokinase [Armatimonadota bacterium]
MEHTSGASGSPQVFASERAYMQRVWLEGGIDAQVLHDETTPPVVAGPADIPNPFSRDEIGYFRRPDERRPAVSHDKALREFAARGLFPGFLEAGARERLRFDPCDVRAAIVTAGGTAPGTNAVIHAIVRRHYQYVAAAHAAWERGGRQGPEPRCTGHVLGIRNGFEGLMAPRERPAAAVPGPVELHPEETATWRELGGCQLGLSRYDFSVEGRIEQLAHNVMAEGIDLLYVIGGDGAMHAARQVHQALSGHSVGRNIVIAGVPKSIDNDIAWMWRSLGHSSALAEAARLLNVLRLDAEANRRVILVELFGKHAGFVAANAALLSDKADCVLIPEEPFDPWKAVDHIAARARARRSALVVLAEGALLALGKDLRSRGLVRLPEPAAAALRDPYYERQDLRDLALKWLRDELRSQFIKPPIFTGHILINQPGYLIRAVPPDAEDLIHAERMGDLVVDSALAGHTGFMLSLWLGYVLVPLSLVARVRKRVLPRGLVWREIVQHTRQPPLA